MSFSFIERVATATIPPVDLRPCYRNNPESHWMSPKYVCTLVSKTCLSIEWLFTNTNIEPYLRIFRFVCIYMQWRMNPSNPNSTAQTARVVSMPQPSRRRIRFSLVAPFSIPYLKRFYSSWTLSSCPSSSILHFNSDKVDISTPIPNELRTSLRLGLCVYRHEHVTPHLTHKIMIKSHAEAKRSMMELLSLILLHKDSNSRSGRVWFTAAC